MKIETYITPFTPENEDIFNNSLTVMIDVLRASTTICSALCNGAREIIPVESLGKAVSIYSSLSKEVRFIGGERHGVKPDGFDAGNSPLEYSPERIQNRTVILTTTNGTRIFQKAKLAAYRIIAAFVNLEPVVNFIHTAVENSNNPGNESPIENIFIICAGNTGNMSYEDTLCAGAVIHDLLRFYPDAALTDSSHSAKSLYRLHEKNLKEFLSKSNHARELLALDFEQDIETAFTFNKYPVVPVISGQAIKKHS